MHKHLIVLAVALGVAVAAPAATAAPSDDSLACTLEKKGILHSPLYSYCYPHNEP